jgi:hypothetical protein
MQEEKFSIFNLMPCTPYELYLRHLKHPSAEVKQIGVPSEEERRDMEVGTDEIIMVDKELQVCYGDDTALLNIMKAIKERKGRPRKIDSSSETGKSKSKKQQAVQTKAAYEESLLEAANVKTQSSNEGGSGGGYSSKLSTFLQRSSLLCETILDESVQRREEKIKGNKDASKSKSKSIFEQENPWVGFGNDSRSGANELVRRRSIVCARFSRLQPNLLITAHRPPVGDAVADDLKPSKALFCIWDVHSTGAPIFVLECAGSPSSCTFSNTQPFVIAGANNEGAVALWDLREPDSVHRDRYFV